MDKKKLKRLEKAQHFINALSNYAVSMELQAEEMVNAPEDIIFPGIAFYNFAKLPKAEEELFLLISPELKPLRERIWKLQKELQKENTSFQAGENSLYQRTINAMEDYCHEFYVSCGTLNRAVYALESYLRFGFCPFDVCSDEEAELVQKTVKTLLANEAVFDSFLMFAGRSLRSRFYKKWKCKR